MKFRWLAGSAVVVGMFGMAEAAQAAPTCTTAAGTATCTYSAVGTDSFQVPQGVTQVTFDAYGAQGASFSSINHGGAGGRATATLSTVPGDTYTVVVGGAGSGRTGGSGGGASGGPVLGGANQNVGTGGGGASDVRTGSGTLMDRILVAGGGGGVSPIQGGTYTPVGGDGGGLNGTPGTNLFSGPGGSGGAAGGQAAGSGSGTLGNGSDGTASPGPANSGGGGGGGGYYGGQGGGANSGGGGGSGFGPVSTQFQTGVRSGNGQVVVSYAVPDTAPPVTMTVPDVPSGYVAGPVQVVLSRTDADSGVNKTYYTVGTDPADPTTALTPYVPGAQITLNNGEEIKYFSTDNAGNAEAIHTSPRVRVDSTPPATVTNPVVTSDYVSGPLQVTFSRTDAESGVNKTYYTVGTDPADPTTALTPWTPGTPITVGNGEVVKYFTTDNVGNAEAIHTSPRVRVDSVPPATVTVPVVASGFVPAPLQITFSRTDADSGVNKTYYTVGADPADPTTALAPWTPGTPITVGNGEVVKYFSTDNVGNQEAVHTSPRVQVDATAPTTTDDVDAVVHTAPVAVTLTATDGTGSGTDKTYYTIGTDPALPDKTSAVYDPAAKPTLKDGEKIRYFSVDKVGNAETPKTSAAAHVGSAGGGGGALPTVPDTTIGSAPAALGNNPKPSFSFSSATSGVTFECSLDDAAFTACSSPFTPATALADGSHTLRVRAVNAGGPDATPAQSTFVVDTTAPAAPKITAGPSGNITEASATFAFTGEDGAGFACAIDSGAFSACPSPANLSAIPVGSHTFRVRQTDRAGNVGPAAEQSFTVTGAAPVPMCFGKPATIVATADQHHITGTAGADVIVATDGDDVVNGGGGNDRICAGGGADHVNGGAGNDRISGGMGPDVLKGGAGNDLLIGAGAKDRLVGGAGNDQLRSAGNAGDIDSCGPGRDRVHADGVDTTHGCERRY